MPQLSRTTKCRYCGKEMAFIKTVNGKSMPVDPEAVEFIPDADYEKFVMIDGTIERGSTVTNRKAAETHIGYRSHFATCPEADRAHRKNKSERTRRE